MASTKPYNTSVEYHHFIGTDNKKYQARVYEYTRYCYTTGNHTERTEIEVTQGEGMDYHRVYTVEGKSGWCNRPWQRFDYDLSRQNACEKLPEYLSTPLRNILVDGKAKEEHEKCERFTKMFEAGWNALSNDSKKKVADTVGMIETPAQADAALGLVMLAGIMQS